MSKHAHVGNFYRYECNSTSDYCKLEGHFDGCSCSSCEEAAAAEAEAEKLREELAEHGIKLPDWRPME